MEDKGVDITNEVIKEFQCAITMMSIPPAIQRWSGKACVRPLLLASGLQRWLHRLSQSVICCKAEIRLT